MHNHYYYNYYYNSDLGINRRRRKFYNMDVKKDTQSIMNIDDKMTNLVVRALRVFSTCAGLTCTGPPAAQA